MKKSNVTSIKCFDMAWFSDFNEKNGYEKIDNALNTSLRKLLTSGVNIAGMMNNPKTRTAQKKAA
jgi:hypothetical protein